MAAKLDVLLKLSIMASVVFASSSVGYYYLVYLPRRDAQMDIERKLDKTRAEAEKHAEQDRVIAEQGAAERRAAEQRAADQRAADQRQTSEKWAAQVRYQGCVRRAEHDYEASWAAACKRVAAIANNTKEYADCISKGQMPKELCEMWKSADASANCRLPRENADDINSTLERTRDRCLQEFKAGLQ